MQSEETSGTTEETNQANDAPGLASLAELLGADEFVDANEEQTPGGDEAESSGSEEKTKLVRFNDLAGATNLDLDALYKLEVSLDDGDEPVTIEQLKDSYKERSDFGLERIEFEETRTQKENELLKAQSELQEILQALPKNAVRPEVLEKIRARQEANIAEERRRTLETIPEWQDAEKRTADLTAMAEHLESYGFPPNYLQQVFSHQQLKYIRDNMRRERRIREALAAVRTGKPGKAATPKPQKKAAKKGEALGNVSRGSKSSKLEAVFSNLE